MKFRQILSSGAMILLLAISSALAGDYTTGEVKKIDMKNKMIKIKHGEIKNLNMPSMTMMFHPSDEKMLEEMKAGDKIEFVVERVQGKLTIKEIKK